MSNDDKDPLNRFIGFLIKIITDSKHFKSEIFKFAIQASALMAFCLALPIFFKDIFKDYIIYFIIVVTFIFVIIIAAFYYEHKSKIISDSKEIEDKMNKISRI